MVDFVFNSALGTCENADFCEPDSDANQFRLGFSILKHAGSRGTAPVGSPPKIYFLTDWINPYEFTFSNVFKFA